MSGLRVIAGTAKGRRLKQVSGDTTRPIMDRVKESLFNILSTDIEEALVLDLFAGTGGVGIEALSRGAARAVFVEGNRIAVSVIQENLRATGLGQRAQVVRSDVFIYLRNDPPAGFGQARGFDFIYIAPPQYKNLWADTLTALDTRPAWLNPDGVAVAQIDPREFTELPLQNLALVDKRKYGSTLLGFYERTGE